MRLCVVVLLIPISLFAAVPQTDWVAKSNENAKVLLNVMAHYEPEGAGRLGVDGLDEQITTFSVDRPQRRRHDTQQAIEILRQRATSETDPRVKQDLEILIASAQRDIRSSQVFELHSLPYANVAQMVFLGIHSLLDDQVVAARRPAALVRLRRYAGLENGYTPSTVLAENLFRAKLKTPGLIGPPKAEVEQDLATLDQFVSGIGLLFEKYQIAGYQEAYASLKKQLDEYRGFMRSEVLPHAREDFRLPPELYAINLDNAGVDYTPQELTTLAHKSFAEIQGQMQPLADKIALRRNLPSTDYRAVVKALKAEQLKADQVMPLYHDTLTQIEDIIRREHLVTLPERPAIVRIATAAETAQQPAPHMSPPPLINNHGERGQFVLPGGTTGADGKPLKYDDFTFAAAAWTLTAHEARPGHELQFDAMVERGVSQARAVFAFNSTNAEGWGLYSEWFMQPYMPQEGQLISLQLRLLRAARAFLDPELQQGKVSPAEAKRILMNDVVLSEAFATEEVDRFTFRAPGQAVSYFDGYNRLLEIRAAAEKQLGPRFNVQRFHDFILSQGLLPPDLLRKAVITGFVNSQS